MNKLQITYKNAKAALDKANSTAEIILANNEHLLYSDNEIEVAQFTELCVKVETDLNIVELIANVRTAEENMVNWMIETVSKSKVYGSKYEAMTTDILANMHLMTIRKMVVELAYKLG